MLDEASRSRKTRICPISPAGAAVSGGRESHERSSGTASTVIASADPVSRWVAWTWTTPLESYESPTSTVTSSSVGKMPWKTYLPRMVQSAGTLLSPWVT